MKRKTVFYLIILLISTSVFSQVGINDAGTDDFNTTPINSNAVLELRSNNKGLLLPRVNAETANLQVEGMLFYDTSGKCFKAWDGTQFQVLGSPCVIPNTPPTATVNDFTNNFSVGLASTGTYTYTDADNDAESGTTFQWKLANDNTGAGATDIAGATTVSYTPVATDETKFLAFCVTPNDGKDVGTQVCSNYMVVDTAPPTTTYAEDFESRDLTGSYGSNNFTGADNTSWVATASRNDAGYVIGGTKSLMLGKASSSLEITFPNGVDKISMKFRKAYTGKGARRLKVSKKVGTVVTDLFTSPSFGATSGRDDTIHSTGDITVGETGSVTLIVKPDTSKQLCVDDFSWTK